MKAINLSGVQEAGEFKKPAPGAYACVITSAEDVPDKEYLKIEYDIADGDLKGYYSDLRKDHPDWTNAGVMYKSYKPKALPMFKRFCSAVSKSNGNYVFDSNTNADEKTLIGKKIGLVFQDEEYYGNDGEKRTRLIVNRECGIDDLSTQKVPDTKKLKEEQQNTDYVNNVPFDTNNEGSVPWS